jgi:hypothetical protein
MKQVEAGVHALLGSRRSATQRHVTTHLQPRLTTKLHVCLINFLPLLAFRNIPKHVYQSQHESDKSLGSG